MNFHRAGSRTPSSRLGRDCSLNFFGVDASQPLSVWRKKGWIHPDDPRGLEQVLHPLLAEEIKRLHGLFGQADDALGREHDALYRTSQISAPSCTRAAHSDSATGALNSEVAPSLEVTVAVNDAGIAPGASTVSAKVPTPSASVMTAASPRKVSPSLLRLS